MSSERTPVDERPADAGSNPYAAPDAALSDLPSDDEIADAVAVHDRHPLLAKVVGDNFALYARRWHLDQGGWARPWHWPALLFEFYWLMYRKMYLVSLLYFLATFGISAVIGLAPSYAGVALIALLGLRIILCVSANELYRWHCLRQIRRAKARFGSQPDRLQAELVRRGGTSGWALAFAIALNVVITVLGEA